jgi:L-iditol 2-dehydrogenase
MAAVSKRDAHGTVLRRKRRIAYEKARVFYLPGAIATDLSLLYARVMKSIAMTGLGRLEVVEAPKPQIRAAHDVRLRVEQVGVCGSDMHYFETGRIASRVAPFPFVLGHECSGTVEEVGAEVRRVKVGDAVAVDPAMSCFQCDQCLAGRPHTCRKLRFLGCPGEADGCLSEWIVMPEASLYPTQNRLSLLQAALCEPLSIGLYAVRLARLQAGMKVGILGAGPIGLCVLLAARQRGARVVAMTDRQPYRVEFARRAGAEWAGLPDRDSIAPAIGAKHPEGLDIVFECAGQQAALDQGVELLKPGGTLAVVGIPREERVSFAIDFLRRKELTLVNVRRQNDCVEAAMAGVASGDLAVDFLATHHFRPEQSQEAFETVAGYRDGVIKAMIDFGK